MDSARQTISTEAGATRKATASVRGLRKGDRYGQFGERPLAELRADGRGCGVIEAQVSFPLSSAAARRHGAEAHPALQVFA
ncbi:hypothetical protein [Methylocella silvestris]|uniref:Uncharacterized protein n=1 Tax=Methylocella silvestris TaxID=199596 RepID=A0A2J7TLF6_METSI|nr:hypothetical protein [Methylocella silvestris]PNG27557.1 hypothetical protein CR492_01145 [Methylocella silvestris]